MFQTVRLLGRDPFQVFNNLGEDYLPIGGPQPRPLWDDNGEVLRDPVTGEAQTEMVWEPVYPKYPGRVRVFLYGLGAFAAEEDMMKTKAIAGVPMKRALGS